MPGSKRNSSTERQLIAEAAAKMMAEDGIESHGVAKRKAAARLGFKSGQYLPDNREIDAVLVRYQQLFHRATQAQLLYQKRKTALAAMDAFAAFDPRLVGPVLAGTAAEHTPVSLHLFSDTPEEVALALTDKGIPFETSQRRLRTQQRAPADYPCYRFVAGEEGIEFVVFPQKDLRQAPLSPVDGKPMRRANREALQALLDAEPALT